MFLCEKNALQETHSWGVATPYTWGLLIAWGCLIPVDLNFLRTPHTFLPLESTSAKKIHS